MLTKHSPVPGAKWALSKGQLYYFTYFTIMVIIIIMFNQTIGTRISLV